MAVRTTRNVSLTPELDAFVGSQVGSGEYPTASEVVRAALRLLQAKSRRNGHELQSAVKITNVRPA